MTRRDAIRYLNRVWAEFPVQWNIKFHFSRSPLYNPNDADLAGQVCIYEVASRRAKMWICSACSESMIRETICHESLHLLFAHAGIDETSIKNKAQAGLSHQIVDSLAKMLAQRL